MSKRSRAAAAEFGLELMIAPSAAPAASAPGRLLVFGDQQREYHEGLPRRVLPGPVPTGPTRLRLVRGAATGGERQRWLTGSEATPSYSRSATGSIGRWVRNGYDIEMVERSKS
jgi:hypothetical protein